MLTYLKNLWLYLTGFRHLKELEYKPGWSAESFWLFYLVDTGLSTVLLATPCMTLSRYAQTFRKGWVWGWLLKIIEKFDPGHGADSGPALWGAVMPGKPTRIGVPVFWFLLWAWHHWGFHL